MRESLRRERRSDGLTLCIDDVSNADIREVIVYFAIDTTATTATCYY